MARVRKALGYEQRACPACTGMTVFVVYESWTRRSRWSRTRTELRKAAECESCGYKVLAESLSP